MTHSTQRRRAVRVIAVLVASGLVGLGIWNAIRADSDREHVNAASIDVGLTRSPASERGHLPSIAGTTLDGRSLDLRDYSGSVIVLNVWGSWCAPCRAEAPALVAVANETRRAGVRFVGIDTRDRPAGASAFVRRFHVPYPSFDDRDGQVLGRFGGIVPISAVPSTVIVDQQGRIAARVVGRIDAGTLRGLINDLLAEASAGRGR